MLMISEAQALVLEKARPLPAQNVPLDPSVLGLVLAEDVASDLDMPPHDKAMMDGYAVRSADLESGGATLVVIEEVMAGQTPGKAIGPGQGTRIMTGAPVPAGADAVVMVERTRSLEDGRVEIEDRPKPGQHIQPRGREVRRGDIVLRAGSPLRPQELGLLAGVGRTNALLHPAPQVAVLATGDELVEPSEVPGPGQIRNSNGPMLLAQAARAGAVPRSLGIARDRPDHLGSLIADGLRADVLILSGGVSAGQRDLVPGALAALEVQPIFHKVQMKPGKPVFFGVGSSGKGPGTPPTLVFGLPGNPVSSLVCFELFVRPALRRLQGQANPGPDMVRAILEEDFPYRTDRPTYHPARLGIVDGCLKVRAVPWFGSPDLRSLTAADALVVFPPGDHQHRAGQVFDVLKME